MSNRDLKIAAAEADVEERRARLLDTVDELSGLFEPRKIVQEVWDTAKDKGADIAGDAVEAVRRRPVAATGIVAALTMFLAREPIKDGIVSIYDAMTSKKKKAAPAAKPAPKKTAGRKPASSRTRKTTEIKDDRDQSQRQPE